MFSNFKVYSTGFRKLPMGLMIFILLILLVLIPLILALTVAGGLIAGVVGIGKKLLGIQSPRKNHLGCEKGKMEVVC